MPEGTAEDGAEAGRSILYFTYGIGILLFLGDYDFLEEDSGRDRHTGGRPS